MREAIQSPSFKGAVTEVDPHPQQLISTLFVVDKGQGTGLFRPVINLKALRRVLSKERAPHCSLPALQGRLHDKARSA